jgi:hypothetical protein
MGIVVLEAGCLTREGKFRFLLGLKDARFLPKAIIRLVAESAIPDRTNDERTR